MHRTDADARKKNAHPRTSVRGSPDSTPKTDLLVSLRVFAPSRETTPSAKHPLPSVETLKVASRQSQTTATRRPGYGRARVQRTDDDARKKNAHPRTPVRGSPDPAPNTDLRISLRDFAPSRETICLQNTHYPASKRWKSPRSNLKWLQPGDPGTEGPRCTAGTPTLAKRTHTRGLPSAARLNQHPTQTCAFPFATSRLRVRPSVRKTRITQPPFRPRRHSGPGPLLIFPAHHSPDFNSQQR